MVERFYGYMMEKAEDGETGDYVRHSDYAALEAECERLRVDAGELVVAQYATSAATVRAEALEARLAEVEKALEPGWQDISSAPKDALVLLSCDNWESSLRSGLEPPVKVGGYWAARWNVFGASWKPTHWRPLPSPPASKGGEE